MPILLVLVSLLLFVLFLGRVGGFLLIGGCPSPLRLWLWASLGGALLVFGCGWLLPFLGRPPSAPVSGGLRVPSNTKETIGIHRHPFCRFTLGQCPHQL